MRKLRAFFLLLALCAALCIGASAATCTGLRANTTVGRDGSVDCELIMTCSFDISQQSLELKLPEGAKGITVYNYRAEIDGSTVRLLADSVFSGSVTFRVDYTLPRAFSEPAEGGQLLKLPLVPQNLGVTAQYVEFNLTLPATYQNEPALYVGPLRTDKAVYTLDDTKVAGSLSQTIPSGQGLSLQLELPDDYFVVRESTLAGLFAGWRLLIVALMLLTVGYWYWGFFRGSRLPRNGKRAMLPDGVCAGELRTLLTGLEGDPAALIAEWACLGYVQLVQNKNGAYVRMAMSMGSERPEMEYNHFVRLFREADAVRLDTKFYETCAASLAERMRTHWVRRLFDRKSGSPALLLSLSMACSGFLCLSAAAHKGVIWGILSVPAGAAVGYLYQRGVLSLVRHGSRLELALGGTAAVLLLLGTGFFGGTVFLAMILLTLAALAVCHGGRRTELGLEKLEQTLAFRRHLLDADPQELRVLARQDGQYFYRMLPYAEALGVAKSFAARFGNLKLEPCAWLANAPACTASEFYARFAPLARSLRGKGKGK